MATCNENGVYDATEKLELPQHIKGWRGMPLAQIRLADLGGYWIWTADFMLMGGDGWGHFSPLMDDRPNQIVPRRCDTRDAAISAAAAHFKKCLSARKTNEVQRIMDWLDQIQPAQGDLFGAAA